MERRRFLGAVSFGMVSLSGCSSLRSRVSTGGSNDTSGPSPVMSADLTQKYEEPDSLDDSAFTPPQPIHLSLEVGDQDEVEDSQNNRPHRISHWNAAPESRYFELQLIDKQAGRVVLHSLLEFSANDAMAISLNKPSEYILNIFGFATETGTSVTIGRNWFDCNASSTGIKATEEGGYKSVNYKTLAKCD